jgi:hypothetical protein
MTPPGALSGILHVFILRISIDIPMARMGAFVRFERYILFSELLYSKGV